MSKDIIRAIPTEEEFKLDCIKLSELSELVLKEFPNSCLVNNLGGKDGFLDNFKDLNTYWDLEYSCDQLLECYEEGKGGYPSCGCGSPENVRETIYKLLKAHIDRVNNLSEVRKILPSIDDSNFIDGLYQFTMHSLDECGFVEHGSSIYGAILTEKGKTLLNIFELYYKYEGLDEITQGFKS